jgi:hypothetical protein
MESRKPLPFALSIISIIGIFLIVSCASTVQATSPATESPSPATTTTPTSIWSGLLLNKPIAFTTPLPEENSTPIDGTYAKIDPSNPQWWECRRCADYRLAGGIWKLQFDKGVMRIYYNVTGWRSIASYTVTDDHLYLFNDPYCLQEVGEYTWSLKDKWGLENRSLVLQVIKDSCSINLRGLNLSAQAWDSCQPPNFMTGASGHWHQSPGCEIVLTPPTTPIPFTLDAEVAVYPGYARKFVTQPDIYVDANKDEILPPDGFRLANSDDSISYGLNRVLWSEGSWVEISTEQSFNAMGVQIYGDYTIGWARVLFDGQEIWRGDTSKIWASLGRNGGYIEVSGLAPGPHTLRVESMGFDYHPVTVAFFGFNRDGTVKMEK